MTTFPLFFLVARCWTFSLLVTEPGPGQDRSLLSIPDNKEVLTFWSSLDLNFFLFGVETNTVLCFCRPGQFGGEGAGDLLSGYAHGLGGFWNRGCLGGWFSLFLFTLDRLKGWASHIPRPGDFSKPDDVFLFIQAQNIHMHTQHLQSVPI